MDGVGCGLVVLDKTAVGGKMVIRVGCAVGEVEVDDGGRGKRRNRGNLLRVSQKGDDKIKLCAG